MYLVIDVGTTQARSCLVDRQGSIVAIEYVPLITCCPHPGWVEQNPILVYQALKDTTNRLLDRKSNEGAITALALTNQRNSVVVWNKKTGDPVYPAIVWQDRREWKLVHELMEDSLREELLHKCGIVARSATTISKLRWILDMVPGVRERAEAGELIGGTIDSWLLWKLTSGRLHATDYSNAAITGLFNLRTLCWDKELLERLRIPTTMLANEVKPSAEFYDHTSLESIGIEVPIAAVAGDQHAAMLGYGCVSAGQAQATIGTGTFLLINTGEKPMFSSRGLSSRVGFGTPQTTHYVLEGTIPHSGTAIEFLVEMGILTSATESESLAYSIPDAADVYFVPAFTGLGTPRWNDKVKGTIGGLSRGTKRAHIVRACLEAIGYQVQDVFCVLKEEFNLPIEVLRVGGGVAKNNFAVQFLSDITGIEVHRAATSETTVLGGALLAGLTQGHIRGLDEVSSRFKADRIFRPNIDPHRREMLYRSWCQAVNRIISEGHTNPTA